MDIHLIALISAIFLLYRIDSVSPEAALKDVDKERKAPQVKAAMPLVYRQLRYDLDSMQILRRYQLRYKEDEKRIRIKSNESSFDDEGNSQDFVYYENARVESSDISHDALIFEALDRTYQTRLLPVYISDYSESADIKKAADRKLISARRCQRDLDFMMRQLELVEAARTTKGHDLLASSGVLPENLAMFDAFASEESGLLLGNHLWPGNWRQCHKRHMMNFDRTDPLGSFEFRGRFCWASLKSTRWDDEIKRRTAELKKRPYFKYDDQEVDYANFFRIQLGICLPESCETSIVEQRRPDIQRLATFKLSEPLRSYQLKSLYCIPDETSELRQVPNSGLLLISSLAIWCTIIMICTLYENFFIADPRILAKPAGVGMKLVSSMSLLQNWRRLTETRSCQPASLAADAGPKSGEELISAYQPKLVPNDLIFLNAIKALAMPCIIFGHTGMMFKHLDKFVLDYDAIGTGLMFNFHACTVFFVDWYFAIAGFLATYSMFVTKRAEKNTLVQWCYMLFHRYWRLAPLYILHFWFAKSLFQYTSNGPLWDYGTTNQTLRSICHRESWIWPVTLTSNLHPLHEECIMPTWYIANDMQYYILMPFLILFLVKAPQMAWLAGLGTVGACIALNLHRYLTDDRASGLDLLKPRYDLYMRNNWDMHPTYLYPHYRISTYIIGVLGGHYTYMVLSGKWTSRMYANPKSRAPAARLTGVLRSFAWTTGVFVTFMLLICTYFMSTLLPVEWEKHEKLIAGTLYSMHHTQAGIAMVLALVAFMLGQHPKLKYWMSHPWWTVVSRINFVVYLIQVEWIYWLFQSADRTLEINRLEVIKIWFHLMLFIYPSSLILHLILESPLSQLEKNFIGVYFMGNKAPKRTESAKQPLEMSRLATGGESAPKRTGSRQ